ncbi:MAG: hypothetical protein WBV82_23620 [Myxococcaceae bacterium]
MRDPIVDQFQIPITAGGHALTASLRIPERAKALIIFGDAVEIPAEDDRVVHALEFDGYATLRLPMTPLLREWGRTDTLARRLLDATNWALAYEQTRSFPIGYFGREDGADACLLAAAECRSHVKGIVACGPAPESLDLELSKVKAPTRLIAGEDDDELIAMNRRVMSGFGAPVDLRIVPGSIQRRDVEVEMQLGRLATGWFDQFVVPPRRAYTPEERGIPPGYWPAG